jgi:hypothetical protein
VASEVLRTAADQEVRATIEAIERLRSDQSVAPPLDARSFDLVSSSAHRQVLVADYIEAQRAFYAEAYKASALLSGGVIEGMLLDAARRPSMVEHASYSDAIQPFPRLGAVR